MGSVQTFKPTPSGVISIPPNYPTIPTPGKIEILWDANNHKLYHKLSPYTDYDRTPLNKLLGDVEPFFFVYPDQNNTGFNALKKYESRLFPAGSAPIDVIRVTKFLASGRGVGFLAKQFLLQTGNPYNETRIYNPTSPIVAAGMTLALGSVRPQRNFDTSAGLSGLVSTLIGSAIPDALFGAPKINPPSGTVSSALPDATLTTGGKGLLRAGTANRGLSHLTAAWPQNTKGSSLASTFKSAVQGLVTSLFTNFIPQNQNGIVARSDEGAYGLMIGAGSTKFVYLDKDGNSVRFGQQWVAGGTNTRKNGQYPSNAYRLFAGPNGSVQITNSNLNQSIPGVGSVGYTVNESTVSSRPGFRYGDNVGKDNDSDYQASDVMVEYASYVKQNNQFPTKETDPTSVSNTKAILTKVLTDLRAASNGTYTISVPNDAKVISSGTPSKNGYDRLFATNQKSSTARNYPQGVLQDYRTVRTIDDTTNGPNIPSMRIPTAGMFDAINTLTVIPADAIQDLNNPAANAKWKSLSLKGWENRQWNPYTDDQVAFYFYDVVNTRYIPFRAALNSISETATATWEELQFIGRADKVYSYGGFNRNLAFTINISISSIAEFAPTWQRINYLTTLIKPANYTNSTINQVTNRFMVPPMVMLTLGDMYKDQPILIQSVALTVPEGATWETLNESNSPSGWEYLASLLKAPRVLYGQLPKQVDIALGMILLEKERAVVGGANIGSAPRTEDWSAWNTNTVPSGTEPNKFHKSLVVDVTSKTATPQLIDAGQPFDNSPSAQQISSTV